MRCIRVAAFVLVAASLANVSVAAPLFTDNFNTAASSASYSTISPDLVNSTAVYGYDYSLLGIPSAPNSGDSSTRGLRLNANIAAGAAQAVNVVTLASYTGKYVVQFDGWINVNGPFPDGGSGSTNYLTAGVGADGTTSNFVNNTGSGGWTAINGENGSGIDYRFYKNGISQDPTLAPQYAAGTAANARNGLNGYYDQFGNVDVSNLPVQGANNGGPAQQNGTSFKGAFGMQWHRVTLDVNSTGGTGGATSMKWYIDNLLIGTLDAGANGSFISNGRVSLGYSDPTSNTSDLAAYSFALVDNLVIIPEPATLTLCMAGLCAIGLLRRR